MINKEITNYFNSILKNIDIILENDFYKNIDKEILKKVKLEIENWYNTYKIKNTLKEIDSTKLKELDLEITDFFDKYIEIESVKENYAERLLYDFGHLEHYWKKEMLGGKDGK